MLLERFLRVDHSSLVPGGGGKGIGRAICQAFAKEGASVAVAGSKLEPVQETTDILREIATEKGFSESQFHAFEVDVSQPGQVDQLVESVSSAFPGNQPLSVAVNNAGIVRDAILVKMSEEDFDDVLRVNLKVSIIGSQLHVVICNNDWGYITSQISL